MPPLAMARRKRRNPAVPLLALAVLAAVGYAAWRWGPALLERLQSGTTSTSAATLDVCALVPAASVASAIGVAQVQLRRLGAGADVPAAGACTWDFERDGAQGKAVAMLFTPASLARGGVGTSAGTYYQSVVTGLEYAYKEVPAQLSDIGDEAAAAGFGAEGEPPQVIVRSGDRVLVLVLERVDRAGSERLARALAAKL